ncbi:hypothetical protein QBC36DRAFT_57560 [Triangularia setosa]|uniref:Uncharacterized protein n=1 Tax=Triangularia setosa TaxID=2587417 RepID=A0AAN6W119_9PEZI|nr:hypothetical protein QBC36DRAFT_57560 [Podospora setosa]
MQKPSSTNNQTQDLASLVSLYTGMHTIQVFQGWLFQISRERVNRTAGHTFVIGWSLGPCFLAMPSPLPLASADYCCLALLSLFASVCVCEHVV